MAKTARTKFIDGKPRCPECHAQGIRLDKNTWHCADVKDYHFTPTLQESEPVAMHDKFGKPYKLINVTTTGEHD